MQWSIGVRDAKTRLSELLRDVRRGRVWTITERGIPVARIVPISAFEASLEERLDQLEARGLLAPVKRGRRPLPPPLRIQAGLVKRYLDEDRAE